MLKLLSALLLTFSLSTGTMAQSLYSIDLGLQTYHFDRDWGLDAEGNEECKNESHGLVVIRDDEGMGIGTYMNSHCLRSYLLTQRYRFDDKLSVDLAVVSGYPEKMELLKGGIVVIPTITYTEYFGKVGISFITVPFVLVGVGFTIKF